MLQVTVTVHQQDQSWVWSEGWCFKAPLFFMILKTHSCMVWWRNQIETFSALLILCGHRKSMFVCGMGMKICYWLCMEFTVNSPHKSRWSGALMSYLICAWTNSWGNSRDACDLRRNRAHYDVTVMIWYFPAGYWISYTYIKVALMQFASV